MRVSIFIAAILLSNITVGQRPTATDSKAYFYVGGYTSQLSPSESATAGITLWSIQTDTGKLTRELGPWAAKNTSYLCLSSDKRTLFSVNETGTYGGTKSGYLTRYGIDPATLAISDPQTVTSHGSGPAYLSVDRSGAYLLSANYGAGNVAAYQIKSNGTFGASTANIQHAGSSVNPSRQSAAHPHSIVASPDNRYVFVPDLGLDQIKVYSFDAALGTLTPKQHLDIETPPGSGPRHLTFHPSGQYAYCTLEMSSQLAAYRYSNGRLIALGQYKTQ